MLEIDQARGLLARAVLTQPPGFHYVTQEMIGKGEYLCRYAPMPEVYAASNDDPRLKTGCLIGTALSLAGINIGFEDSGTVSDVADRYKELMSPEVVEYYSAAQRVQDTGGSWDEAYRAAENSLI